MEAIKSAIKLAVDSSIPATSYHEKVPEGLITAILCHINIYQKSRGNMLDGTSFIETFQPSVPSHHSELQNTSYWQFTLAIRETKIYGRIRGYCVDHSLALIANQDIPCFLRLLYSSSGDTDELVIVAL
ncbi:hypothetical protein AB6A40_001193 [Gnathostoma spinigerum]|uniref:Uncharacterized protein n=1 Tax=Gnathostoma spinigerum TaxID=75299 RepID=A0ABD6E8J3_9BILA